MNTIIAVVATAYILIAIYLGLCVGSRILTGFHSGCLFLGMGITTLAAVTALQADGVPHCIQHIALGLGLGAVAAGVSAIIPE